MFRRVAGRPVLPRLDLAGSATLLVRSMDGILGTHRPYSSAAGSAVKVFAEASRRSAIVK